MPLFRRYLQMTVENALQTHRIIHWHEIRKAVGHIRLSHSRNGHFWQFALDLTQLFEKYECQCPFIAELLLLAWNVCYIDDSSFHRSYADRLLLEMKNNTEIFARDRCWTTIEFMKIFFIRYNIAHQYVDPRVDCVTFAATTGQIGMLELLLRFGATAIQPRNEISQGEYCSRTLQDLFSDISYPRHRFERNIRRKFCSRSRRRLFLVSRGLKVLSRIRNTRIYSENYIASLRLLFRSIPEPFITGEEIDRKLNMLFQGVIDDKEINSVSKEFEKYFPESRQPSGPRSLKHLSRCQVRENLRASSSAFHLTRATESLPLPKEIKEYILLKEEGILDLDSAKLTRSRLPISLHYESLNLKY